LWRFLVEGNPYAKNSAPEAPEDFLAPVSALVTLQGLQEPVAAALDVGPSLEGPAVTSSSVSLPLKGVHLQEPTTASSAVTPPSERVNSQEPIISSPAVIVPPSEKMRPQELISTPSAVVTPLPEQVCLISRLFTSFPVLPYSHAFFQGLNLLEFLAFDPASVGPAILGVNNPQPDLTRVASQLLRVKDLLSASIDALVQDSSAVRQILEEINSQLPVALQIKLWPTGHLPFFRARIAQAHHRIETHHSQAPLKANITERCRLLNETKVVLDAKADASAHSQRLLLLEKELEDLKARV
jgi:hypothetical protein